MNWDVGEDAIIHNMASANISKIWSVVTQFEYVMVAFDQDLIPRQIGKQHQTSSGDRYVSKYIYFVFCPYHPTPIIANCLVLVGGVSKWPSWAAICVFEPAG
jgi:hypothetical protein